MDTFQLTHVLKSDKILNKIFHGVFPIDKLPQIISKPAALVINTDDSTKPSSHWICMYFDEKNCCEFFDSYGRVAGRELEEYMLKYATKIKCNKKCVQKVFTSTCGQLCVYYLVWRARDIPMRQIMESLEKSYADEFVTGFVNNLFKINTSVINYDFIIDQICEIWTNSI